MTPEHAAALKQWAARRSQIMKAYRRGVPKAEIARKHGVSRQRIQMLIRQEEAK